MMVDNNFINENAKMISFVMLGLVAFYLFSEMWTKGYSNMLPIAILGLLGWFINSKFIPKSMVREVAPDTGLGPQQQVVQNTTWSPDIDPDSGLPRPRMRNPMPVNYQPGGRR